MNADEFNTRFSARARLAHVSLTSQQLDRLRIYFQLLTRWNRTINVTGWSLDPVTDEAIDRLLIEPLAAANHVQSGPIEWVDLGSGCGSPAIPLRIVRPAARLTMIESRARKAAFLREVVRQSEFSTPTTVLNERFEDVAIRQEFLNFAEVVTVRAVRIDRLVLESARRFLRKGGKLLLFGATESTQKAPDLFASAQDVVQLLRATHSTLSVFTAIS